jgi:pyruvate dehydrogenase E2 component (dihydrolipoamide acetyltransferase)
MATQILMPALSPTMTEGTLARWLKNEGDKVASGDVIAEIETDKATMEVEAVDEGVLGKILIPGGTANVKVNEPIAILLADGESADSAPAPKAVPAASAPAPVSAAAPAQTPAAPVAAPASHAGRIIASPLAKRIAQNEGVDLASVKGSGPNGRIVRADVEAAIKSPKPKPVAPQAPAAAPAPAPIPATDMPGLPAYELAPHSSMRKVIARRLTESKRDVPHFYLSMDVGLDALLKLRADLNKRGESNGYKLSVNDFIIKASAMALKRKPAANAAWTPDAMLMFKSIDISVAVAIPGGLITPIIRDADKKGVAQISNEMKDLAKRAKEGKLKPEEFQGGTFSISNLGMFGISSFSAIINPPQAAILAVGQGEERAVVRKGAIAIETQMTATLSVDHRVIDGALGAELLQAFKDLIEDPLAMLV